VESDAGNNEKNFSGKSREGGRERTRKSQDNFPLAPADSTNRPRAEHNLG
jgi:hypothetical protein